MIRQSIQGVMPVHPIGFSIHESKIVSAVPAKTRLWAKIVPGRPETYVYTRESDYYGDYRDSWFAHTTKKAGWDCLRHYEILANGCIPFFQELGDCPAKTMTFFPKQFVKQYESLATSQNFSAFQQAAETLLTYTRTFLTNRAMATMILQTVGRPDARRILFLSGTAAPDYLRCLTLVGFKDVLGAACHDVPRIPHIYTDYGPDAAASLYGRGMTYTCLVDPDKHDTAADATVTADIASHAYDLVVYGSYHRGMPFYKEVMAAYTPSEVILLCGEDIHGCDATSWSDRGHPVFVREL